MLAGVELGGTKCICILGTGPDDIRAQVEIPTTTPTETLSAVAATLTGWDFAALGLGSFGPLDLDPASASFGSIVSTPKPGWSGTDITHVAAGRPFMVDTDVNGAALAEGRWGAAQGLSLILPDAMSSRLIPPPTLISIALSPGRKLKRGSRSA